MVQAAGERCRVSQRLSPDEMRSVTGAGVVNHGVSVTVLSVA